MVMTHPPALLVWKFLMKNMIPTNSVLKHHNNEYKTSWIILDKKVTESAKIRTLRNKQTYPTVQTVTENTITYKHTLKLANLKLLLS